MIVLKFGGTSVGSAERIRAVADRIRERLPQRPVLVVSAFSRVTDLLLRGADLALARDTGQDAITFELLERPRERGGEVGDHVPVGRS